MDRFEQVIQLVRNNAVLEAEAEMGKKVRASVFHTSLGSYEQPVWDKDSVDRICESSANAAEQRLIQALIKLSSD